jgi:hypothetical protein
MALLYADENFPFPVVEALRHLGHDVLTSYEDGRANQRYPDETVLARAGSYGRAVLTTNRKDFIQLHKASTDHYGIIVCTYDPDFAGQARRIVEAVSPLESLKAKLIRINRPA